MAIEFKRAQRKSAKLRLGISGPSGSGKTLGALMIAKGIGGNTAVIDTERDSASLYSEPMTLARGKEFEPPEFDALSMSEPYSPERFIKAIQAGAAHVGVNGVLILDSITPEWSGIGGCLEINENLAVAKYRGNTWSAWSETTPRHRAFLEAIVGAPCHIIATMRSKTETAQEDVGGKKKVVKLGMKAETREGSEYEFTTVLDLIHAGHFATASKDRTGLFSGDPEPLSEATGVMLREWLERGGEETAKPVAKVEKPSVAEPPEHEAEDAAVDFDDASTPFDDETEHPLVVAAKLRFAEAKSRAEIQGWVKAKMSDIETLPGNLQVAINEARKAALSALNKDSTNVG